MQTYTGGVANDSVWFSTEGEMFEEAARLFNEGKIDKAHFRLPDGTEKKVTKRQLLRFQEKEGRNKEASATNLANIARASAKRKKHRRNKNKMAKATRKANR